MSVILDIKVLRVYRNDVGKRDIKNHNYFESSDFNDFNEIGREKIACKNFTRPEDKILVNEIKQHITVNDHENIVKFLGITACKIY
ncbi:13830_t:CDS:2 [Dentiscutata heterogama]|uniref:13830_t:CDS:1 n=1 Tax=Dentiscutata heterogama TaxID=1316150 RepID=A0ACA9LHS4_9GLOM|nr:13830_t:CDS:2 [Dentiscutata heterogama]